MHNLIEQQINTLIDNNMIMIFMKGHKNNPQCGFSNTVVQIFNSLNIEYETFNVLEDLDIRNGIKEYSQWPTIPQVYIRGEFIGGADIILELYKTKELFEMIETLANN